jgi:hypothetical protein
MSGKRKRLLQIKGWLLHISTAPPGSALQVGIHYDHGTGWRVYQSIAGRSLALRPPDALIFAEIVDDMRQKPGWAESGFEATLGRVRALAVEAAQKNRMGVKPEAATVTTH